MNENPKRVFKITAEDGEEVLVTIQAVGIRGELEGMVINDLLELNMTDWSVEKIEEEL